MTAKGREFDSRPSSAVPLEESSLRPGDQPVLYKRNGENFHSAEPKVLSDRRSE